MKTFNKECLGFQFSFILIMFQTCGQIVKLGILLCFWVNSVFSYILMILSSIDSLLIYWRTPNKFFSKDVLEYNFQLVAYLKLTSVPSYLIDYVMDASQLHFQLLYKYILQWHTQNLQFINSFAFSKSITPSFYPLFRIFLSSYLYVTLVSWSSISRTSLPITNFHLLSFHHTYSAKTQTWMIPAISVFCTNFWVSNYKWRNLCNRMYQWHHKLLNIELKCFFFNLYAVYSSVVLQLDPPHQ